MNLALDIGNSSIKAGLFDKRKLIKKSQFSNIEEIKSDSDMFSPSNHLIISSVRNIDENLEALSLQFASRHILDHTTKIPIINKYASPETLGNDRLAVAIAANQIYPNKNCLIIDAGTCITFDFITEKSEYLGGSISPGLKMRFEALNKLTRKLPLVETNLLFKQLIGDSTQNSILSGVMNGIVAEVNGLISQYQACYSDLTIVITGGDCDFFAKRLKNRIFAHPHLVLEGLNEVLIFNS